jgi:hypothetical protein
LEASGGSLHTRGRASRCDRESVGGLRQDGLEAPHGALLSTRRKSIGRREGRAGRPRGRREPSTGGDGSMSACRLDDSTGGCQQATHLGRSRVETQRPEADARRIDALRRPKPGPIHEECAGSRRGRSLDHLVCAQHQRSRNREPRALPPSD